MATNYGTYPIVGHAGTISIGGSSVSCTIASFEPSHSFDTHWIADGDGITRGGVAVDEKLEGTLTFEPQHANTPVVPVTPAPYAQVILASFSATAGSTAGRSYINGKYVYVGNWAPTYAGGELVRVSMTIRQYEAFPTQ